MRKNERLSKLRAAYLDINISGFLIIQKKYYAHEILCTSNVCFLFWNLKNTKELMQQS